MEKDQFLKTEGKKDFGFKSKTSKTLLKIENNPFHKKNEEIEIIRNNSISEDSDNSTDSYYLNNNQIINYNKFIDNFKLKVKIILIIYESKINFHFLNYF